MSFIQPPFLDPVVDWQPTPVTQLPSWVDARRVAIDCETCDPTLKKLGPGVRRDGYVVGVSFAIEDGPAYYLPMAHASGGNLDAEHVVAYLRDQAAVFTGDLVGARLPYDLDYFAHLGISFDNVRFFRDVQVAEPLINELQLSYSLANIARKYRIPGKSEEKLREAASSWGIHPKSELWKLPARHVAEYAIQDVLLPLAILRRQERIIEEQDLWEVYDLESRVLPVLLKMQRRGVRIDLAQLDKVERYCAQEEESALLEVEIQTGITLTPDDVWKAEAVAAPLREIGVDVPATATGKPSTKADFLETVDHPVANHIIRARRMNKVRTTFVKSIREHMTNGRIHCSFNQLRAQRDDGGLYGAAYGRLSSSNPNMQQQPARDPVMGPMWRSIYLPEEGMLWACADYSSQEPRMTVHYASKTNCTKADEAVRRYCEDIDMDPHQATADMAGISRKEAKILFLGICYGMGSAKLCHSLGLPTRWKFSKYRGRDIEIAGPEGEDLLKKFRQMVPFVQELADKCTARARKKGHIRTLSGRRCRFPIGDGGKYEWTHKALNRLIQGSSADQTKMALVAADAAGIPLMLQVHDELDLSVNNREEAQACADMMKTCVQLRVPSKVDVEIGDSWGTVK